MQTFKELFVWQKSISLVKEVYLATGHMPKDERFGLVSQMKRSSVSIPSNIAEGYKRRTRGEYIHFLGIADASAAELETQIIISSELYNEVDFDRSTALLCEVQRMLFVMIRKLVNQ